MPNDRVAIYIIQRMYKMKFKLKHIYLSSPLNALLRMLENAVKWHNVNRRRNEREQNTSSSQLAHG